MKRDVSMRPYSKKFKHSYVFGVYPTIELLKYKPERVLRVLLNTRGRDNQGLKMIQQMCSKMSIKTEWADGLINKLGGNNNTYAVGVFEKYHDVIQQNSNHLVLVSPEDTGNLGTIMRSCLAYGFNDLVIIKPAVDCFDPKTIRASMGAIFKLRIRYYDEFSEYTKSYQNKIYPFVLNGKTELSSVDFMSPFSLVYGGESGGLPSVFGKMQNTVTVRQSGSVDSLNLATAVGIGLYEASK